METSSNEGTDRSAEIHETDEVDAPLLGNTGIFVLQWKNISRKNNKSNPSLLLHMIDGRTLKNVRYTSYLLMKWVKFDWADDKTGITYNLILNWS